MFKRTAIFCVLGLLCCCLFAPQGYSKVDTAIKIGYVDLRRAFYEYEKTKSLESELTKLSDEFQNERTGEVKEITKLRDEAELLKDESKGKKQGEIENKLKELQDFDRRTRQELLDKKNDMFRKVIDDIQGVVERLGKKNDYDYVLDSRNIMYGREGYDLTNEVLSELNKK
ncbi:MAG: OmpH family outer membrane protein [Candidatus Omnitrophota bacterium]